MPTTPSSEGYSLSLLDRLCDDRPRETVEPPFPQFNDEHVFRAAVLRDLQWLFNTTNLTCDLSPWSAVAESVLNFGVPALSGLSADNLKHMRLERSLQEAIVRYEPRLHPESVDVRVIKDSQMTTANVLMFEVRGDLIATTSPLRFRGLLDLETAEIALQDVE